MTYSQVIAAARTDAQRARFEQIQDCTAGDPNMGLTAAQIGAAMQAVGYASSFPALAVNYYLAIGQDVWPQCGGVGGQEPGAGVEPTVGPNGSVPPAVAGGFDADTLILIFGGLIAFIVIKRWME